MVELRVTHHGWERKRIEIRRSFYEENKIDAESKLMEDAVESLIREVRTGMEPMNRKKVYVQSLIPCLAQYLIIFYFGK